MDYKLLATDMDATSLNAKKELTTGNIEAVEKAISVGKHVIFCTGRNISVVKPYISMIHGMKYAVTDAGATIYDCENNKVLYSNCIDEETIKWIISAAAGLDVFPILFLSNNAWCPEWAADRAEEFHVGAYAEMYRKYMSKTENVFNYYMENPVPASKFNLLFTDAEQKEMVYEQIRNLPITFTTNSEYALEINANGVSKFKGLQNLCKILDITTDEIIALGDAENDYEMIKHSGLGVAVGNAQNAVIEIADEVVEDCEHDGLADAIYKFLI